MQTSAFQNIGAIHFAPTTTKSFCCLRMFHRLLFLSYCIWGGKTIFSAFYNPRLASLNPLLAILDSWLQLQTLDQNPNSSLTIIKQINYRLVCIYILVTHAGTQVLGCLHVAGQNSKPQYTLHLHLGSILLVQCMCWQDEVKKFQKTSFNGVKMYEGNLRLMHTWWCNEEVGGRWARRSIV